ncbi:DUF262 domain-containing protein [Actinocrinis puniceicyclus]|uniref:DUF262 domain-containing protein n=1 Tax=Actinocrinis puniceicyclus TaxID=977794 RepID=A0A8J8BEV5_9ACTN|nr:DUF262 domain-containing protein [Actinocrinis puniceicyclus]MBS2965541.1 DUF262 domain-containing protein [Actinocrinis puniceicyclus]
MTDAGLDTQPSAVAYELDDLVQLAWSGRIRVPHFQRDFRWGTQDVVRLFDSILRGYPVGSLLLWSRQSPAARFSLGALEIAAAGGNDVLWVVDGQQRVTSLANALHPDARQDPRFTVDYDLADSRFVPSGKLSEPRYLPLPVLYDLDKLLEWFHDPGSANREYFAEARRVAKLLRQFKIPATVVRQEDETVLTDIFDRLNNYGKRLSRAEILSALFAGPEGGDPEQPSLTRIAQHVASRTGFGNLDTDTVLHAILARRGPDPARDIRSEFDDGSRRAPEFPAENQATAFLEGEKALIRAVRFLQDEAGVPHRALLAYKALLVVLTRFFAHFPEPAPRNIQLLRRVYWRAAIAGPVVFKGSFTGMSRTLCALIVPGDEAGSVESLAKSMQSAAATAPELRRFRTNEAAGKIVLCSWWALRPRSLVSGEQFDSAALTDLLGDQTTAAPAVRTLFPRGVETGRQLWAANRIFVPSVDESADTVWEALAQQPVEIDAQTWDLVLASYCLDRNMIDLLNAGRREEFLARRQDKITDILRAFLLRMAEWSFEDTPALSSLDLDELDDLPDDAG